MADLLLVEDDGTIAGVLATRLTEAGHTVTHARTGADALAAAGRGPVDLVLLDLGLPDGDGTEVCRRLRSTQPEAVVVVISARSGEMDVVLGLEAGADDYLIKPLRFAEVAARVRAHLRRAEALDPDGTPAPARRVIGALALDTAARRATVDDREIGLRAKEFDLLARLAVEPGTVVLRETLMSDVWDEHWSGSTKTLDVHVAALRRKLADAAARPERAGARPPSITTVRGHGYRLEPS